MTIRSEGIPRLTLDGTWLGILFLITPLATALSPRATPIFLALVASALAAVAVSRGGRWKELLNFNLALTLSLALSAYVFLNSMLAVDQLVAFRKAATLVVAILIAFVAARIVPNLNDQQVRRAAIGFVAGALIGALYLTIELLSRGALTRALMNYIPFIRPTTDKHVTIVNDSITQIRLHRFNPLTSLLMLQLWPVLLSIQSFKRFAKAWLLIPLLFFALPIFMSWHDSSKLAFVLSLFGFASASYLSCRLIVGAAVAVWCAAFLLIIPISLALYHANLYESSWLPSSFRHRILIWESTSEGVMRHPLLGMGIRYSREVQESGAPIEFQHVQQSVAVGMGRHAHSLFLQTWFELGAVGVILSAIVGAVLVWRILKLPEEAQPYGVATFAAFVGIAAFSWDIWETWWIAAVALVSIYLALGATSISRVYRAS